MALAVIGLVVSIYMTIYKLTENNQMCLGSGDCATVNSSRYAEVSGVPVAMIGIAGYAAILAVQMLERRSAFLRENGALILFGLSLTGFLFTVYLIYVEIALIKAFCPFCITSQITMTLVFGLAVLRLVREFATQEEMNAPH
jgi:uncharacterized membrane protein